MVRDTADANDHAVARLDLQPSSTVLEVGFGQGRTVAVILDRGHRVLGVDASATMVSQATARNRTACRGGRARLLLGDGVTVPFDDDSADAAFTVHTVYFMPNPRATFGEIARVLRPRAALVVACRTSDTPLPAWMDPAVYRIPTAAHLTDALHAAGFADVGHDRIDAGTHDLYLFTARTTGARSS
jgi:ubiquinone/menaquinone biosynthesis C-methylase UbiE